MRYIALVDGKAGAYGVVLPHGIIRRAALARQSGKAPAHRGLCPSTPSRVRLP
jgi:hypothetical protein